VRPNQFCTNGAVVQMVAHGFSVAALFLLVGYVESRAHTTALDDFGGLANRTPFVRIETRARNAVTTLWPDADHARIRKGSIAGGTEAMMFGPHTARLLRAALGTGIDARVSRDAGSYLCNYLSWRAIEATCRDTGPRLAAFVHVPLLARDGAARRDGFRSPPGQDRPEGHVGVGVQQMRRYPADHLRSRP